MILNSHLMCFKPESEVNRRSYIWTCIEKWWRQDGDSDSVWWHDHSLQSVCCSVLQAAVGTGDCCIVCCWAAVAPLSQGSDGLLTNFLAVLMVMAQIMLDYYKYTHKLDCWIGKLGVTNICVYISHVCPLSVYWVPPPHPLTPSPPSHA